MKNDLETTVKDIAKDVKDINKKMTYFLENYRDDYNKAMGLFRQY